MALRDFVNYRTESGATITAGDVKVTPQSQVLSLMSPYFGWVWNRPVAVLVERDGEIRRYPIVDATRYSQIGFIALGAVLSGLALMVKIGRKRDRT